VGGVNDDPIDGSALLRSVADHGCGAEVLFLGTVRRSNEDGPVVAIDYTAYAEMAGEELDRIVGEARTRWSGAHFAVRHRLGEIPVGEPSIGVAVAAPHRAEAYAASRFIVDEAKRRLPVWKKERFEDGSSEWRENAAASSDTPGV
jgi:molybdopterin synthase catalytic subunit